MTSKNLVPGGSQFIAHSPPPFNPPLMLPRAATPVAVAKPPPLHVSHSPSPLRRTSSAAEVTEDEEPTPYHVQLSGPICQFSVPSDANILIDHGNRQLVALYQRQICRYPYDSKRIKRPSNVRFESSEYDGCSCGRFSPDREFIAAQISPSWIEFTDLASKKRLRKSSRRGSRIPILGYFWLYSDNFFLVTSESVEFYKLTKSPDLKLLKEYKLNINWFVYSHGNRFLACAIGPLSNIIQGFYFEQPDSISRMPRFQIDLPGISSPLSSDQILICNIYRRLYCLFINPRQGKIDLFQYNRDKIAFTLSLDTHCSDLVYVHVVDNLLVVHNPSSSVPMIFDIQDREAEFPFVAPLPLAPLSPSLLISANPPATPAEPPVSLPSPSEAHRASWEYLQPRFVLDRKGGNLWQTALDVEAISESCHSVVKRVHFLLRRLSGKPLLLQTIADQLAQHAGLELVAEVFQVITTPLADTQSVQSTQRQRLKETSVETLESMLAQDINRGDSSKPLRAATPSVDRDDDAVSATVNRCPNGLIVIEQQDLYSCFTRFDECQPDHR